MKKVDLYIFAKITKNSSLDKFIFLWRSFRVFLAAKSYFFCLAKMLFFLFLLNSPILKVNQSWKIQRNSYSVNQIWRNINQPKIKTFLASAQALLEPCVHNSNKSRCADRNREHVTASFGNLCRKSEYGPYKKADLIKVFKKLEW